MNNRLAIGMLFVTQLILASCMTMATTESEIAFHEVTPPDDNTTIIYVYRLPGMVGKAVENVVSLDGEVVAVLNQNAYVVLYTTRGDHTVTIGNPPGQAPMGLLLGLAYSAAAKSVAEAAARDAALPVALRRGALPRYQVSESSFGYPSEVYFFRSEGFKVAYVPSGEAMNEIIHMKYEPNLNQEAGADKQHKIDLRYLSEDESDTEEQDTPPKIDLRYLSEDDSDTEEQVEESERPSSTEFAEDSFFYCGFTNTDGTGQDYAKFGKGTDFKYNESMKRWEWVDQFTAQYIYPDGRYEQIEKTAGFGSQKGQCNSEMEAVYKKKMAELKKKHGK